MEGLQKKSSKEALDRVWTNASKWAKENVEDNKGDAIKIIDQAIEIISSFENREEAIKATADYLATQEIDLLDLWDEDERLGDYLRIKKGMEGQMGALRSAMELARIRNFTEPDERLVAATIGRGRWTEENPPVDLKPKIKKPESSTVEGKPVENFGEEKPVGTKNEKKSEPAEEVFIAVKRKIPNPLKPAEIQKPPENKNEEIETNKRRPGIREFVDAVVKLQTWEEFINILAAVNRKKQFFKDADFDLLRKKSTKSNEIDSFHQTIIRKLLGKLDKTEELGDFIELYRVEYDQESAKHEGVEEE